METAEENFQFTIFKGNYETILSRILIAAPTAISIAFPFQTDDGKAFLMLFNHKELDRASELKKRPLTNYDSQIYMLQIIEKVSGTFHLRLQFYSVAILFIECSDSELQLLTKISKKLYRYYCEDKDVSIQRLYLNMLLQYLEELLSKNNTFIKREEVLSQQFLELLYKGSFPEHQVRHYAEKLFVSRRYLTKAVHASLSETPKILIDRQIIKAAKKLLEGNDTIYAIAEELKFESSGSFATFFKKHTGYTASQYRALFLK